MAGSKPRTVNKLFALESALARPGLTKADIVVLAVLIEYNSGIHGFAWPSIETLAAVTGLTRRKVQLATSRLADARIINIDRGGGRAKPNRYRINLADFSRSPYSDPIKRQAEKNRERKYAVSAQKGRTVTTERVNSRARNGVQVFARTLLKNPAEENPSANAASPDGDARHDSRNQEDQNLGQQLRQFEDWLKACQGKTLGAEQREHLETWVVYCRDMVDAHSEHLGDPIGGWAGRLAMEAEMLLLDPEDRAVVERLSTHGRGAENA